MLLDLFQRIFSKYQIIIIFANQQLNILKIKIMHRHL